MNTLISQLTRLSLTKSICSSNNAKLLSPKLINNDQKRNRGSTIKLIRGPPRPPHPFKPTPRSHDYRYVPILPEVCNYDY